MELYTHSAWRIAYDSCTCFGTKMTLCLFKTALRSGSWHVWVCPTSAGLRRVNPSRCVSSLLWCSKLLGFDLCEIFTRYFTVVSLQGGVCWEMFTVGWGESPGSKHWQPRATDAPRITGLALVPIVYSKNCRTRPFSKQLANHFKLRCSKLSRRFASSRQQKGQGLCGAMHVVRNRDKGPSGESSRSQQRSVTDDPKTLIVSPRKRFWCASLPATEWTEVTHAHT